MSARFHIRLPALETLIREQEVAAFLGDDGPSTVQIIEAAADMLPILERHAERTFTNHGEIAS